MKQVELNEIIEQLEKSNSEADGYFAIYQYGGEPDESFAKANKIGLRLFATQLLKASQDFDTNTEDKSRNIIPLNYQADWIDGDIFIQYIEPTNNKGVTINQKLHKPTLAEKLPLIGCFAAIIFLITTTIIGLITMFKWIF